MEEKLISMLDKYNLMNDDLPTGKVVIQSFSKESLLKVSTEHADLPLIQLIKLSNTSNLFVEDIKEIKEYAVGIGINHSHLSRNLINELKKEELLIHPYTVNNKADFEQFKDWGVDGVITNYIDVMDDSFSE